MPRSRRSPSPLSDFFANLPTPDTTTAGPSAPSAPLFETVPDVMRRGGRVEGFESLRDLLLANWRSLAAQYEIPLQALLKLVLETDRHALFAMLSEEKLGDLDQAKQRRYREFQQYLEGQVETPAVEDEHITELPGNLVDSAEGESGGADEDVQG